MKGKVRYDLNRLTVKRRVANEIFPIPPYRVFIDRQLMAIVPTNTTGIRGGSTTPLESGADPEFSTQKGGKAERGVKCTKSGARNLYGVVFGAR